MLSALKAYMKDATVKNACSEFRKRDIFPFNLEVFDEQDFTTAETTNITGTITPIEISRPSTFYAVASFASISECINTNNKPLYGELSTSNIVTNIFNISPELIQPIPAVIINCKSKTYRREKRQS